jgi:putative ABC transport system permease protein
MKLFALKILFANRGKLITALIGVSFSLVLVCVQGGLFFGLIRKASLLIDHTDADIWIGHRLVENVDLPHNIPESRLNRIRGLPDVKRAEPFIIGKGVATLPDGGYEDVWIIGSETNAMLGSAWRFKSGSRNDLLKPDAVSFDHGDARKLGYPQIGETIEINGKRARIVAETEGIMGFLTTPYLFTTLENARKFSKIPEGYCSYFLVQAEDGVNIDHLQNEIQQQLDEFDVYQAGEFSQISQDYWMKRTGIGISFGTSTLLGMLVGLVMVAQSLYAMSLDHIHDYATLKAIGAEDRNIFSVVMTQALAIASCGTIAGVTAVLLISHFWSSPLAPIEISPTLILSGIAWAYGICILASIIPLLRIQKIDPVIVLQS